MRQHHYSPAVERFARQWDMPMAEVDRLVSHANYAKKCAEFACNGDTFPLGCAATEGKSDNSRKWQDEQDTVWQQIAEIAAPYGFTGVTSTGLRPQLLRGDSLVEIP